MAYLHAKHILHGGRGCGGTDTTLWTGVSG
jgi:hypothetical protein